MESRITSTPVTSEFEIIKQKLTAHIDMLRQHFVYLSKIEKNLISEDDIFAYLKDALGFAVPDNGKFKTDYLPVLLKSLRTRMEVFLKLAEIAKSENQEVAISALYLGLELELAYAKYEKQVVKSIVTIESKCKTIFCNPDSVNSLRQLLEPLLSESHSKLTEIIYLEQGTKAEYRKKDNMSHFVFDVHFRYDWLRINSETQKIYASLRKIKTNKSHKQEKEKETDVFEKWLDTQAQIKEYAADIAIFRELNPIFQEVMKKRLTKNRELVQAMNDKAAYGGKTDADVFDMLLDNVVFYYDIAPKVKSANKVLQMSVDMYHSLEALEKEYNAARGHISARINACYRIADLITQSIKKVYLKKKWQASKGLFEQLLQEIDVVKKDIAVKLIVWPEKNEQEWTSELIQQKLQEFEEQVKLILTQFDSIEAEILLEQAEQSKTAPIQQQSSPYIPSVSNTERELYLKERKQIDAEYKQAVEQRRQEKAQIKPIQEVEKKEKKPASPVSSAEPNTRKAQRTKKSDAHIKRGQIYV